MSNGLLFSHINIRKPKYLFTESYLHYFIAKTIFLNKNSSVLTIIRLFNIEYKIYGEIKKKSLLEFIKYRFLIDSDNIVHLSDKQEEALESLTKMRRSSTLFKEEEIYNNLKRINNFGCIQFSKELLFSYLVYEYSGFNFKDVLIDSIFFDITVYCYDYFRGLDYYLIELEMLSDEDPIDVLIPYNEVVDKLKKASIKTTKNLKDASRYLLIILFNRKISCFLHYIKINLDEIEEVLIENLNTVYNQIEGKEFSIVLQRHKGLAENRNTLEEVGEELGLTRERVRQIEAKTLGLLSLYADKNRCSIENYCYHLMNKYETNIIDIETFANNLPKNYKKYLLLLENIPDCSFSFDSDYKVIYIKEAINLSEKIDKIYNILDDTITADNKMKHITSFDECLQGLVKRIIEIKYKKYENTFIKADMSFGDLVLKAVDFLFPTGYKLYSEQEYLVLLNYFKTNYYDFVDRLSQRAVAGILGRKEYCLVDKGTYRNRLFTPKIHDDLLKDIMNYINQYGDSIYYRTLFDQFQVELERIGINNNYFLKGVVDSEIKKYYYTHRDYIGVKAKNSPKMRIREYVLSFNNVFSFKQLKNRFSGIEDYVIYGVLYEIQDLIWLSNKKYILLPNINIDEETIQQIIDECEKLFKLLDSNYLTSRKLYARLKILKPEVISRIQIVTNHYDLFSVIKLILCDKYYFRRPIISLVSDIDSQSDIVRNYTMSLKRFSKSDLDEFIYKMNLSGFYSFLSYIDEISDDFVQVNQDFFVKKELFDISDETLRYIIDTIDMLLKTYREINTVKFKGFYLFPKLEYKWNKYLLAGLCRSYFEEYFSLINTENSYNNTDFIIRRIKNG